MLKGRTNGLTVRRILVWMNTYTYRLHNGSDNRKFNIVFYQILHLHKEKN